MPIALRRNLRNVALMLGLLAAVLEAGCGDETEPNYSASRFSQCLESRDISAENMDTSRSENRYFDVLHRLAAEASEQNGALEAFGSDSLPAGSTVYFLFFRDASTAQGAQERLGTVAVQDDDLTVRGNLLTVASSETEAQRRIAGECLDQSGSER
jgi:hypothetical protein